MSTRLLAILHTLAALALAGMWLTLLGYALAGLRRS